MSETQDPQARRVDEIRARCEAATPGPWGYAAGRQIWAVDENGERRPRTGMRPAGDTYPLIGRMMDHADGEFSAYAREDVPFLLSELARLSGEVRRLEDALREARCPIAAAIGALSHERHPATTRTNLEMAYMRIRAALKSVAQRGEE